VSVVGVWNERIVPEVRRTKAATNYLTDVDDAGELTARKANKVAQV
jgi:hypothetical protein